MKTQPNRPRSAKKTNKPSSASLSVIAILALLSLAGIPAHALALPTSVFSIQKVQSGLVASDPLNNVYTQAQLQSQNYWTFGGSALGKAPYAFYEDASGLHIGVQAPAPSSWAGFYAESHPITAQLFHAVITTPARTVSSGFFEPGLYFQTSDATLNYVFCGASTGPAGTYWAVIHQNINGPPVPVPLLWADYSPNQPLTRDCTMVSNGSNYLAVYLDGNLVFQASNLDLQMGPPFNPVVFLETQTSYPSQLTYGTYSDYYATTGDSVTVTNIPPLSSQVQIVDPSGNVLASASVSGSSATLPIANFHFPLVANIVVTGPLGLAIASTTSPVPLYGGDTYQVQA